MALDFAQDTLPWLDRYDGRSDDLRRDVEAYVAGLDDADDDLAEVLVFWAENGYFYFENAIDEALIDAYVADLEDLLEHRAGGDTLCSVEGLPISPVRDRTTGELRIPHSRLMDFHNQSVAGKHIMLHPKITSFLGHVFQQPPMAMQSLTFKHGTEQHTHQDFAFVVSNIPSHLAASWIALEDVHEDAGPLACYPGSQFCSKFDFGNGMFLTPESEHDDVDFARHLEEEMARRGIEPTYLTAKKGDVLMWHASLVHAGSKAVDNHLTRRSFVCHYSSIEAYPRDRRKPDVEPVRYALNGGQVFQDPVRPEVEDSFERGLAFGEVPLLDPPAVQAEAPVPHVAEQVVETPAPAAAPQDQPHRGTRRSGGLLGKLFKR